MFRSEDVEEKTQFGDYRVDGGIMTATGYNDFLGPHGEPHFRQFERARDWQRKVFANISRFPFLQVNMPQLSAWVDEFIRRQIVRAAV